MNLDFALLNFFAMERKDLNDLNLEDDTNENYVFKFKPKRIMRSAEILKSSNNHSFKKVEDLLDNSDISYTCKFYKYLQDRGITKKQDHLLYFTELQLNGTSNSNYQPNEMYDKIQPKTNHSPTSITDLYNQSMSSVLGPQSTTIRNINNWFVISSVPGLRFEYKYNVPNSSSTQREYSLEMKFRQKTMFEPRNLSNMVITKSLFIYVNFKNNPIEKPVCIEMVHPDAENKVMGNEFQYKYNFKWTERFKNTVRETFNNYTYKKRRRVWNNEDLRLQPFSFIQVSYGGGSNLALIYAQLDDILIENDLIKA
jgi:hypothetical protein